MRFDERIAPPLKRVCHKLVDAGRFQLVESVANFMTTIASGRWNHLATDEQLFRLKRLSDLLGARSLMDSWDDKDKELQECHSILDAQIKALENETTIREAEVSVLEVGKRRTSGFGSGVL